MLPIWALGPLQLSLAELDDGGQPKLVAGLREVEGQIGLRQQLPADVEALLGGRGIKPTGADVAGDVVLQVAQLLLGGLGAELRFAGARRVKEAVKDRNLDIKAGGAVPGGERIYCQPAGWSRPHPGHARWEKADHARRGDMFPLPDSRTLGHGLLADLKNRARLLKLAEENNESSGALPSGSDAGA